MLVTLCLGIDPILLASNMGQQVSAMNLRSTHLGHASGQLTENQALKMFYISILPAPGWQEQSQTSDSRGGVSV